VLDIVRAVSHAASQVTRTLFYFALWLLLDQELLGRKRIRRRLRRLRALVHDGLGLGSKLAGHGGGGGGGGGGDLYSSWVYSSWV
jgi:hypothetical protein